MSRRTEWIQEMSEEVFNNGMGGPIWEQAIDNVRLRQEVKLNNVRASDRQDELEIAEFKRLARIKARQLYEWKSANVRLLGTHPLRAISLDGGPVRESLIIQTNEEAE